MALGERRAGPGDRRVLPPSHPDAGRAPLGRPRSGSDRRWGLADRRRRPRRHRRLAGVVLGVVTAIVAVQAVRSGAERVDGPDERLVYADRVRPLADASVAQGAELADLRADAPGLERRLLDERLARLAEGARGTERAARELGPPPALGGAHSHFLTALATRAGAAERVREAITAGLAPGGPDPVPLLVDAGRDLAVADRAAELWLAALSPPPEPALPASSWLAPDRPWGPGELATWWAEVRARASPVPEHGVAVTSVATDPTPVRAEGPALVLPPTPSLRVEVVVANVGARPAAQVPVTAAVTGTEVGARALVDLESGQRRSLVLEGLRPPPGPATLTVRVGPVAGDPDPADDQVALSLLVTVPAG